MNIKIETAAVRNMTTFERITKVHPKDCLIKDDNAYFLVDPASVGIAIGKKGAHVRELTRILGKNVKIFGYSSQLEDQVRQMIPSARSIQVNDSTVTVSVAPEDRVTVIGRGGSNINAIKEILKRHFSIKNFRLR